MQTHADKLCLLLLVVITMRLPGQDREIDRLINSELRMTFPSIYFKHNSTDYAGMPYTADSCLRYIAANTKDITGLSIWRDSLETEALSRKRIEKLKAGLLKYAPSAKVQIRSMREKQKISRHTISMSYNDGQKQYLLSLNSVLDIAKARTPVENQSSNHRLHPKINCWGCWKNGFHLQTWWKMRKIQKQNKRA